MPESNISESNISKSNISEDKDDSVRVSTFNLDKISLSSIKQDDPVTKPKKLIQTKIAKAVEHGKLLVFPKLKFNVPATEKDIFSIVSDEEDCAKRIMQYDPASNSFKGSVGNKEQQELVQKVMQRYAQQAQSFIHAVLPEYSSNIELGVTSFRMGSVDKPECADAVRKKDQRLHIDASAANPMQDKRVLRFYTNINPSGEDRVWHLGESFSKILKRFAPQVARPMLFSRTLFKWLGITRGSRSLYDHYMLNMNSLMKKDKAYQQEVKYEQVSFSSGSSWLAFIDQISYGVLSGKYVLEQTFYIPVKAMKYPDQSPLKQLQKFYGRSVLDI